MIVMSVVTATRIDGRDIHVNEEGFLTEYDEWDEALAAVLAVHIGIELTEAHWTVIRFLRADYKERGETPTTRRVATVGGIPVKQQFALFPKKPGKKMAYIAGLPKPKGCV
jgi:tRNA 2-thiouridine synthesizing protein E